MWLFRIGQMLGLPQLLLKGITGWKLYLIIGAAAFSAGAFSCYKITSTIEKAELAELLEKIHTMEQAALQVEQELRIEREIVYKDRIKEVVQYVETNTTTECFNDTQLVLFNSRD